MAGYYDDLYQEGVEEGRMPVRVAPAASTVPTPPTNPPVGYNLSVRQRNLADLDRMAAEQRARRQQMQQGYAEGRITADQLEREYSQPTYGSTVPPSVRRAVTSATPESTAARLQGAQNVATYVPMAMGAYGLLRGAGVVNPASAMRTGFEAPSAGASYLTAGSPGLSMAERLGMWLRGTGIPARAGMSGAPARGTVAATTAAGVPILATQGVPNMPFGSRPAAAAEENIPVPPVRPAGLGRAAAAVPRPPVRPAGAGQAAAAPMPPERPAALGRAGAMYQSTGEEVISPTGQINFGDPNNPADFARADAALQRIRGAGQYASGGSVDRAMRLAQTKEPECHSGIINMAVGGRTDHIPMHVLANSYVLPADIVSGLGEGNTLAGTEILNRMFKMGPYGTEPAQHRASPKFPQAERMSSQYEPPKYSKRGGAISEEKKAVPIIAAGGEYVVPPEVVKMLGEGSEDAGHEYLDNFVKYVRDHVAKTLKNLPGPRRD